MSNRPEGQSACPNCGAVNDLDATRCWMYSEANPLGGTAAKPWNSTATTSLTTTTALPQTHPQDPFVTLLMEVIAGLGLLALIAGVFRAANGLGILLAIVVGPAFLLTIVSSRRRHSNHFPSIGYREEKSLAALVKMLCVMAVIVGVLIALVVTFAVAGVIFLLVVCTGMGH